ncbi:MAG: serine/threonine-protein kinase [Gemmataceae bacterium]
MPVESIDTLLAILRRTQLFSDEQVEEMVRELVPCYQDPQALGEYLVEIDWLTPYQLHLILSERWKELTYGVYQILDRLGEGGLSEVFKAWDTEKGRVVALKVLRPDLAENGDLVRQFQREALAITRLSHPNIIRTFDVHDEGALQYFAMEYIEGMDLDRYVGQVGPLAVEQACDYGRQVAQGLQYAHQVGLIHRDIKPANLFLLNPPVTGPTGQPLHRGHEPVVKIIDWGLARCTIDTGETQMLQATVSEDGLANERASLIGTADYIAPEQAQDATLVDIRADIYSLGCVLYYLLTGYPPFRGSTLMQKLVQHQKAEPPSVRGGRPDVPEDLDQFIRRMMGKSPGERPQIPLLVVAQLRKFCVPALAGRCGASAPASAASLPRPVAPPTGLNLPRPQTHAILGRPSTQPNLPRPGGR